MHHDPDRFSNNPVVRRKAIQRGLDSTVHHVSSVLGVEYDDVSRDITSNSKKLNVRLLKSNTLKTNISNDKKTLYVSPDDIGRYYKLKDSISSIFKK